MTLAYNNLHIDKFRRRSSYFLALPKISLLFFVRLNPNSVQPRLNPILKTFSFFFLFPIPSHVATPPWPSHKLSLSSLCPCKGKHTYTTNTHTAEREKRFPPETLPSPDDRPQRPSSPSLERVCVTTVCISFPVQEKDMTLGNGAQQTVDSGSSQLAWGNQSCGGKRGTCTVYVAVAAWLVVEPTRNDQVSRRWCLIWRNRSYKRKKTKIPWEKDQIPLKLLPHVYVVE